jgi:hypothetical protein
MPVAIPAASLSPDPLSFDAQATTLAASAVAAVIDAGAKILVAEPWRAGRIMAGAEEMTFDELSAQFARRRRAPFADLNRAIAFAQLGRALASPSFRRAWDARRSGQE